MSVTFGAEQRKRLAAFGIGDVDLRVLQENAAFVARRLPALLGELHGDFADWPEIQAALMNPAVHAVRVAHWVRVASGDLGEGFDESARRLASAFYEHGVPGYAVAICHATVGRAVTRLLTGADAPGPRGMFGGRRRARDAAIAATLNKVAWLDLELLLETYAAAERDRRRAAVRALADRFDAGVGAVIGRVLDS